MISPRTGIQITYLNQKVKELGKEYKIVFENLESDVISNVKIYHKSGIFKRELSAEIDGLGYHYKITVYDDNLTSIMNDLNRIFNYTRYLNYPENERYIASHIIKQTNHSTEFQTPKLVPDIGDFTFLTLGNIDKILEVAKEYRNKGYWAKIQRAGENTCQIYISKWKRNS